MKIQILYEKYICRLLIFQYPNTVPLPFVALVSKLIKVLPIRKKCHWVTLISNGIWVNLYLKYDVIFGVRIRILPKNAYFCKYISLAEAPMGNVGGRIFLLKSVYLRSSSAFRNLENFNWSQGWSNSRCLMVCLCVPLVLFVSLLLTTLSTKVCYIHIGVRLLCCSFYSNGHSRASKSRMSS